MKRPCAIAFVFAVTLMFLGMGLSLHAQVKPQPRTPQRLGAATPASPCCSIIAFNTATGVVTLKENAAGRIITFQIASFQPVDGAKLSQTFKVGSKVDFQPVDGVAIQSGSRVRLTVAGFQPVDGITASITMPGVMPAAVGQIQNKVTPGTPCCSITAVNAATGVVTAKVNATGKTFQFNVADSTLLNSLKIGQGVYANFGTKQVSANGTQSCCNIVNTGQITQIGVPKYNFQKCCQISGNMQVLGPGATKYGASVNGTVFTIGFVPLSDYSPPSSQKTQAGPPCVTVIGAFLYADFGNNLVSSDGVTPCGLIYNSVETVYLDVVPVGVIYVPPGDPKLTGGAAPSQQFTSTYQTQHATTTSTVSVNGQSIKVSLNGPVGFTGSSSNQVQHSTTQQQQDTHSFMSGQTASGGGGFPGKNDVIVLFVNPTYDVQYLMTPNPSDPSHPSSTLITSITPHMPQHNEPGPQWELVTASATEIDTRTGNGVFLNDILQAPPKAPVPINSPSGTSGMMSGQSASQPVQKQGGIGKPFIPVQPHLLDAAQRLLALDPMVGSMAPPYVPAHPERFTPITSFQDTNGTSYGTGTVGWTYCSYPGPTPFTNTEAQTSTVTNSITTKFTSGVTLNLSPTQLLAAAGVPAPPGVSTSAEFGETWEMDYTTQFSDQTSFSLSSKGQFGSGTVPYDPNAGCPNPPPPNPPIPKFNTTMYYDWQNLTILFWTQQVN